MRVQGLIVARMCRFFSHYGIRTLMILYLIDSLRYDQKEAFAINTVLVTLFELGSIFGGMLADRLLGFKRALLLGSVLLTLGYSSLIYSNALVLSFGLMIMGGNLMVSNIPALIGKETADDPKKQSKYMTILYAMQNLGALISIPLLGVLKDIYGYEVAFAVAGSVMGLGVIALLLTRMSNQPTMKGYKVSLIGFISMPALACLLLQNRKYTVEGLSILGIALAAFFVAKIYRSPLIKEGRRLEFIMVLIALIFFFAIEDQMATSLVLYADKMVNPYFLGMKIPPSAVAVINPVIILALAPLMTKKKPRLVLPFLMTAFAMFGLSLVALLTANSAPSILWVLGVVGVISISELYIGPLVFQKAAEVSHEESRGEVMGMVPIAFCLAFLSSGLLGSFTVSQDNILQAKAFAHGFQIMACLLVLGALIMAVNILFTRTGKRVRIEV